ncbi:MAG: transposase [candidate division Zixibacteria bacterium]|nr:transposase [candidate division Zixibacteria bacterium]
MVIRRRLPLIGKALVFVTTSINNHKPTLSNNEVAEACLQQLSETLVNYQVSLVGYVLMPTHIHLLLGFPHIEQLSEFMQRFKGLSALRVKEILARQTGMLRQREFKLWKSRFDDVITVSEEQFRIKLGYIHMNPVKAGLAASETEWKYSSAGDWILDRAGILPVDKNFRWNE